MGKTPAEITREALDKKLARFFELGARDAPSGRPWRVLELGCGDGRATEILHHRLRRAFENGSAHLVTLDAAMESVASTRRRLRAGSGDGTRAVRVAALGGDFYRLPLRDESFDYAIALNVFYWADRRRLLTEARRVLRPTGHLLLFDRFPDHVPTPMPFMTYMLPRDGIARLQPKSRVGV